MKLDHNDTDLRITTGNFSDGRDTYCIFYDGCRHEKCMYSAFCVKNLNTYSLCGNSLLLKITAFELNNRFVFNQT